MRRLPVIAVASLILIVLVFLLVARIATVAFVATGLPYEVARFQARSALTGVGFTTGESETVVGHPVRRRIVMALMLVGNAGFVSIVASVMLSFVTSATTTQVVRRLLVALAGLVIVGLIARSQVFERRMTSVITRMVDRFTDLELRDYHHLMQLSRDYAITELLVDAGDWLAGRSLHDLELPEEGVLVLAIQRANGSFEGAPRGQTIVRAGDTLILYGRAPVLSDLAARPATDEGDHAHEEAVAQQAEIMSVEPDGDHDDA